MPHPLDWLTDPDYAKKREAAIKQTPGLAKAADAAAWTDVWIPNTYFDSETGQSYSAGGDWGTDIDPGKRDAYIDKALEDPVKWVASNLNWSGLGDRGDFSALDDQIKFLKDNKYDTSTLDKGGLTQYNLTKQILAQGTTSYWTGAGFGSPVENAKHMASTLMTAGIENIKDFGKFQEKTYADYPVQQEMVNQGNDMVIPTGRYFYFGENGNVYVDPNTVTQSQYYDPEAGYTVGYVAKNIPTGERTVYGNKNTKQAITQDYNGAYGNFFSGTYHGHGRTNFGVQFAADGTPVFYTQFGGDTSSMADIAPFLAALSIIPTPLQPFAAAANALISIDNGNTLGGLAALAGIPGVSEAASAAGLANVVSGIQTANQVVNLVNAVESGNIFGAIVSGAGLVGSGSVASGAADAANVARALESGDPLAILSSGAKATGLLSTVITDGGLTVSDALKAANLAKAIDSGDPTSIFNAAVGFAQSPNINKSLNNQSTTITADGQKVADLVDESFVADLVNPDSDSFLGNSESSINTALALASEVKPVSSSEEFQEKLPDLLATVTVPGAENLANLIGGPGVDVAGTISVALPYNLENLPADFPIPAGYRVLSREEMFGSPREMRDAGIDLRYSDDIDGRTALLVPESTGKITLEDGQVHIATTTPLQIVDQGPSAITTGGAADDDAITTLGGTGDQAAVSDADGVDASLVGADGDFALDQIGSSTSGTDQDAVSVLGGGDTVPGADIVTSGGADTVPGGGTGGDTVPGGVTVGDTVPGGGTGGDTVPGGGTGGDTVPGGGTGGDTVPGGGTGGDTVPGGGTDGDTTPGGILTGEDTTPGGTLTGEDTIPGGTKIEEGITCPEGYIFDPLTETCVLAEVKEEDQEKTQDCGPGYHWDEARQICVADEDEEEKPQDCPEGYVFDLNTKTCVPVQAEPENQCGEGFHFDEARGICIADTDTKENEECPEGYVRNLNTGACELVSTSTPPPPPPTPPPAPPPPPPPPRRVVQTPTVNQPEPAISRAIPDEPMRRIGLPIYEKMSNFEGPLSDFLEMVQKGSYISKPTPEVQPMQPNMNQQPDRLDQPDQSGGNYFNYGQESSIDNILNPGALQGFKQGGMATPLMAAGGTTRYGMNSGGALDVVHHSGKQRLDFRSGAAVTGEGDGQSDDIPAMLADGEFVFPADVVAALGNGSTKAGSDKLYDMMHAIRAHHRSAKPEDLPPPAKKSPLDYLKTRKARG